VDKYAYVSELRAVHPGEKILFTILTMIMVLSLDSLTISLAVLFTMSAIIIFLAKIPYRVYLTFLLIPIGFLLVGCFTIALIVDKYPDDLLVSLKMFSWYIGVSKASMNSAVLLFFGCLACISCLYFMTFTTPVPQLIYIMQKMKMPGIVTDLTGLIYNTIFIMLETVTKMYSAQKSRSGYCRFSSSLRSFSLLLSNLFIVYLNKITRTYNAMLARGFNGQLQVLEEDYPVSIRNIVLIIIFNLVLVALNFLGGV
jgi:cobalt/nickel transport system permease protein